MCTVMVIQQMPTKCVQANDNGPYMLPHVNLYLSLRQGTHAHSFFLSLRTYGESAYLHNFCQKKNRGAVPHTRQILRPNTFFNRKSVLRNRILFASPEDVHRPRSDSPLHFDSQNIYLIRMEKINASARRLLSTALLSAGRRFAASKSRLQNY